MYEFFKCHTRVSSSAHHTPPLSAGHSMRGQGEGSLASLPIHEGIRWSLKIKIEMIERKGIWIQTRFVSQIEFGVSANGERACFIYGYIILYLINEKPEIYIIYIYIYRTENKA